MGKIGQSTISLCMIVKDEEQRLPRCLESVASWVDEICIVDTGSTDRTVAIASIYGAKVRTMAWPGSFAVARNASLEMATSDWILVLDADEVLRPEGREDLARAIDDPRNVASFVRLVNIGDRGQRLDCLILRLFRNDPNFRFRFAIHEQVIDSILERAEQTGGRVLDETLCIEHDGYMETVKVEKNKDERNRLHFERAVAEEPDCAYLWYKYGDFLRRFSDSEATIRALSRAVELVEQMTPTKLRSQTYCAECYTLLALEHVQAHRHAAAMDLILRAESRCLPSPMMYWVKGHAALGLLRWDDAEKAFEACRSFEGKAVHVPAQPGITSGRSVFGIARARLGKGEKEAGIELILEGARKWPDCEDLVLAAARIEMMGKRWADAIRRITDSLTFEPRNAAYWQLGAELLLEIGNVEKAAIWSARAEEYTERRHESAVRATAGEVLLSQGLFEAALERFCRNLSHPSARAGLVLVAVAAGESPPVESAPFDAELLHSLRGIWRRLSLHPIHFQVAEGLARNLERIEAKEPELRDLLRSFADVALATSSESSR